MNWISSGVTAQDSVQNEENVPEFSLEINHKYDYLLSESNPDYRIYESYGFSLVNDQVHMNGDLRNDSSSIISFSCNTFFPKNGTDFMLQLSLGDSANANSNSRIQIKIADEIIPLSLWNCDNFTMNKSELFYDGSTPVLNNTMKFNHIDVPTYGQGESYVDIIFRQVFRANWTEFTTKYEMEIDLRHCKLFSPSTHLEYSNGTPFSVVSKYWVGFFNQTKVNLENSAVAGNIDPEVTPNMLKFNTGLDDNGFNVTSADFSMNGTFRDVRQNQTKESNATSYFELEEGHWGAYAYHVLENFSYADSCYIYCDPIVRFEHDRISNSNVNSIAGYTIESLFLMIGMVSTISYWKYRKTEKK